MGSEAEEIRKHADRKLAAIMFTDIVGYTALSQTDEAQALEILKKHNLLLRPLFGMYNGTEIKTIGDSFLVLFESTLDAVNCAIEIQKLLHDYNISNSNDDWKIKVRIGIHLGDVVRDNNDIFGDAVNIASRLQSIANPEGVCISQQVLDQVHNKISCPTNEIEKIELKNVKYQMKAYSIILPWEEKIMAKDPLVDAKLKLNKLRVAVLPFKNMSPDHQDEYFADGMTEELISTLSAVRALRVVSRTSVMSYKATEKRLYEIGKELGVGAIVEGSVRKAGTQIRVTVQLIDASSDEHLWSEMYDRRLDDIFAIQSDVSERVAKALSVKLTESERERVSKEKTLAMQAFESYLLGKQQLLQGSESSVRRSIELFKEAVAIDPDFAEAYSGLARAYESLGHHSFIPIEESYIRSKEMVDRALKIDGNLAEAHATLGFLALGYGWNLAEAEKEFKKAIELDASNAYAHVTYTRCLAARGRLDEAVAHAEIAAELDPLNPKVLDGKGMMYFLSGRKEAFETWKKAILMFPNMDGLHFFPILFLLAEGRYEEAQGEFSQISQQYRESPHGLYLQGLLYGYSGRKDEALKVASNLRGSVEGGKSSGDLLASIYASIGDTNRFFELARVAVKLRHWELYVLKNHDKFYPQLKSDPRWNELLTEAGLD